ncbi:MAG: hypothetical protein EBV05_08750 [Cyanobacteria bacterium WB6_1B_304]|nr:hypothetical protein [Cyanobacteria bacterium WB6_1B_304]
MFLLLTSVVIMTILRQYIIPLLIGLVFLFAWVAVSVRIFLPADMAAPAPIGIQMLSSKAIVTG